MTSQMSQSSFQKAIAAESEAAVQASSSGGLMMDYTSVQSPIKRESRVLRKKDFVPNTTSKNLDAVLSQSKNMTSSSNK